MKTAFVARPYEHGAKQTRDFKAEHDFTVSPTASRISPTSSGPEACVWTAGLWPACRRDAGGPRMLRPLSGPRNDTFLWNGVCFGMENGPEISAPASDGSITVEGVRLTHPDRVLYPEQGITKLALARYYAAIRDWILPELRNRPLSLVRCPEGEGGECFYQKHVGAGIPDAIGRVEIAEKSGGGPISSSRISPA